MGVSSTLLASGGIRARWSANGTDAYAEVNSDGRISKGIKFATDGSLVDIVGVRYYAASLYIKDQSAEEKEKLIIIIMVTT